MNAYPALRTDIVNAIGQMETATKSVAPERKAQIADAMQRRGITDDELRAAVVWVVESWEGAFMPPTPKILAAARSPAMLPTSGPTSESRDAIVGLEHDIEVQHAWLRQFEARGDEARAGCVRRDIAKLQERVNARRAHRGQGARYVAPGVEVFGSDDRSGAGRPVPVQRGLDTWGFEPDRED